MKLRALLILATMVLGGMLLSGVVLAVTKTCNNNCKGTSSRDSLTGDNSKNKIHALGGGDSVKGLRGEDWLYGEGGDDGVSGGPGVDYIDGGIGKDRLDGKKSGDTIIGVDHVPYSSTALQKQRAVDVLIGGRGRDTIKAKDGKKDVIRGGPGYDKAYVDRVDKVKGVEKEVVPGSGGTGGGNPPPKQCQDGKDNDGDGKIDSQDSGCASATDDTENSNQIAPQKQCQDGKDNDGDGKTDLQDPGCTSATDDDETDTPVANNAPVAEGDSYSVPSCRLNVDARAGVLSNDTDADGNTLRAVLDSPPTEGVLELKADGSFMYDISDCVSSWKSDSFTYKATDSAGDSDVATVSLTR